MHFFFDPGFTSDSASIANSELVHFKALRISAGEEIGITTGTGKGFIARVLDPGTGQLEIIDAIASRPSTIHLVQSIAKGGRDESAIQFATELGIASVTALQAERSVSRWDSKVEKNLERWRQILISAMKQSQQLYLPSVEYVSSAEQLRPKGLGLVLDPRSEIEFGAANLSGELTLVIGPEGGFSETELSSMTNLGFTPVRFGDSILRTSSAGPAAIACVKLMRGDYGQRLD